MRLTIVCLLTALPLFANVEAELKRMTNELLDGLNIRWTKVEPHVSSRAARGIPRRLGMRLVVPRDPSLRSG